MKMKISQLLKGASIVLLGSASLLAMQVRADQVDDVLKVGQAKVQAAQASQAKIDQTADQTDDLLQEYKVVNKQIEGLRVYNAQMEARIADQLRRIAEIEKVGEVLQSMARRIQLVFVIQEALVGFAQPIRGNAEALVHQCR